MDDRQAEQLGRNEDDVVAALTHEGGGASAASDPLHRLFGEVVERERDHAFAAGRPAAAALDPTIMAEVADAAVGEKTHLLAAFSRGWNAANAES